MSVCDEMRAGSARSAPHPPHVGPTVRDVDRHGAGEAERFVEPNQLVSGGFQVRGRSGVVTVACLGAEQGRRQTLPPGCWCGAELVQVPVRLRRVHTVQCAAQRERRRPATGCAVSRRQPRSSSDPPVDSPPARWCPVASTWPPPVVALWGRRSFPPRLPAGTRGAAAPRTTSSASSGAARESVASSASPDRR